jgi:ornithine cyclodeaminase/alanine dehydrogenase-like protein (mu-crystallin family)
MVDECDCPSLANHLPPEITSSRTGASERAMFLFAGDALADLAAARLVYEAARERGLGVALPR